MRVANTSAPTVTPAPSPKPATPQADNAPKDTVESSPAPTEKGPGFFKIWGPTMASAAVGAGAGLYAGLHGNVTGAIAGVAAGGIGGLFLGTTGAARLGYDSKSMEAGWVTGAVGAVAGGVAGYAGHSLVTGLVLAAAAGAGAGFVGMMSSLWPKD